MVDKATRLAYFTIIQGKNQHQTRKDLEKTFARYSISFKAILVDNGKEFKGIQKPENDYYKAKTENEGQQYQLKLLLEEMQNKHCYTEVRRPQTKDKVEKILPKLFQNGVLTQSFSLGLLRNYKN